MAPGDPLDSEPAPADHTKTTDRVSRVLGATRLKAASGIQAGAYQFLVDLYQVYRRASWDASQSIKGSSQAGPRSRPVVAASEIQDTSVANCTSGTVAPAMTTKSYPWGSPAIRTASRSLRFARLRTTALPIRRPATSPTRTFPGCPAARTTTKSPTRRRRPVDRTVRKLAEERSEAGLGGETLAAFCPP